MGESCEDMWRLLLAAILVAATPTTTASYPSTVDCRNMTWEQDGGELIVTSWHIHYTTNTTAMALFQQAFTKEFENLFPPENTYPLWSSNRLQCPFGPNFGSNSYKYVCSLEADPYEAQLNDSALVTQLGGSPWSGPQSAFFIPLEHIAETWAWAKANRGYVDVLKHPNTGCMHDDHSTRAEWVIGKASTEQPPIDVTEFPCNNPGTGCNDNYFQGAPSCGCSVPLKSDAPADSCYNCIATWPNYLPTSPGYVPNTMPLVPNCTAPALGVDYTHIKYYSGKVSCGNLMLEADIGGGVNIPPVVTYANAEKDARYTLLMIDNDADLKNNGSWPDVTTPGSHAPVRHWVVGNIGYDMLATGDFAGATTISAFVGPSPPYGSHRYGQYLFKQPDGVIDFAPIDSSKGITNWDYGSFVANHSLGTPVATNWHVTQHAPPRT